jgi:hypothetical protein
MIHQIGLVVFGLCLVGAVVSNVMHLIDPRAMGYTRGPLSVIYRPGWPRLAALVAGAVLSVTLAVLFVIDWHRFLVGPLYLVVGSLYRQWERAQWQGDIVVEFGKYAPAAATLLGYLVGSGIATLTEHSDPEWAGWQAACGVLGACFTLSAFSKWQEARWRWFQGTGVQLLIAERALLVRGWRRRLRERVARSVAFTTFMSGGAFSLELLGFVFVIPELRVPFWIGGVGMLAGFFLFLGYFEIQWLLVLTAMTLLGMGSPG